MIEQLSQIDVSPIAELVRIKQEEQTLRERLAKVEAAKEKVSPVVYRRVRQDYESRQAALDADSLPLKERVRREYAKLRAVRAEVERSVEEVSLEKEELEFRRDLGEFAEEKFQELLSQCEKRLGEKKQELAEINALGDRFVEAFPSEQELEVAPGSSRPPVREPAKPVAAAPPESSRAAVSAVPSGNATVIGPGRPAPPAGGSEATRLGPRIAPPSPPASPPGRSRDATVLGPRSASPPPPPPSAPAAADPSATRVLSMPRILTIVDNQPTHEYVLKPGITSIGRSAKNQIRLPQSEVSRHHANIVFDAEGCRVVDLGGDNGVYANGQRVKEHVLADGDIIQIGTQKLMYKS